jgi:hypothetical protein
MNSWGTRLVEIRPISIKREWSVARKKALV